jgi:hypothetical protein
MAQISVEYAHIYTNQHISKEHRLSVDILREASNNIITDGNTVSLVVMVDDYSFPDPSFDYAGFIEWLNTQGFKPDLLFRESQLIPVCDEVLSLIEDEKLKRQIIDYVKTKKYPCSLFIAAWYLLRLGRLEFQIFPRELRSDRIYNILPESFKPFEDKGIEIIKSTKFADAADLIQYKFLQGRLIT